ncbi:MAG: ATP-binding protein [Kiritimatiellae bacterium]|nr:ATP-binding protein [Kiritimatiellia bacterium]
MFSSEMFANRVKLDNPWWQSGTVNRIYTAVKPRLFIEKFYHYITLEGVQRSIVLMGPRRVGKTWLIQHAIDRLLTKGGVLAKNVIFLPIDVPVYHGTDIEELVNEACRSSGANLKTDRLFVFFDEIQYRKDWEISLKTLTDSYPNIRFIASGSAASVLARGARESGAGRFTDLKLAPLTFYEYIDMIGKDEGLFESMEQTNKLFIDYVNFGGYPELASNQDVRNNPTQFIQRDIVDKVLLRDLPSLYHIDDVRDLQSFFSYIAFHTGTVQTYESLAQGSGLTKHTISNLLQYLEEAFLIVRHDRVDVNALSLKRAVQFKLYLTNSSLRASMFQPIEAVDDPYFGYTIETAIASQLGISENRHNWKYANWRVGKEQHELDFVQIDPGTQKVASAFEVKWSDGPFDHPTEVKDAAKFAINNGLKSLVVTSRTQTGKKHIGELELSYLPTARLAYQLGKEYLTK